MNQGHSVHDSNYIFFHDQEPIYLDTHADLFAAVVRRNQDLRGHQGAQHAVIVTSEHDSRDLATACQRYGFIPAYYFFHGWAALDWFRGYNRSCRILDPRYRTITHTFVCPNRIIGGRRVHRVELLYWIFRLGLEQNHISCPVQCPAESQSIMHIAKQLTHLSDAQDVFASACLPRQFAGESDHPMHSCWLSLFDQCNQSLVYVVTETVAQGKRHHLTEKIFKPIAMGMPFVLVSAAGSLAYLRQYGFRTFGEFWDEGYDDIEDEHQRIYAVANILRELHSMSRSDQQRLWSDMLPVVTHNWQHFYHGGFEAILWQEMTDMLAQIKTLLA